MIKGKVLQDLVSVKRTDLPITSAYFSVGSQTANRKSHLVELKKLIRYKNSTTYFKQLSEAEQASVERDFDRLLEWYGSGLDTTKYTSSICFSSSAAGVWKTIDLKRPLQNELVIQPLPYIRPLVNLFSMHRNYGLVLVDRSKARILESRLGVYKEHFFIEDNAPESVKVGGFKGREERKVERNIHHGVVQHYKDTAQKLFDLNKEFKFNWIIIGGRKDTIAEFQKYLHDYVASKVQGKIEVEPSAPLNEVLEKVRLTEDLARENFEKVLLEDFEQKRQNQQGCEGMVAVLEAIRKNLIQTLIIQENFIQKGVFSRSSNYVGLSLSDHSTEEQGQLERTNDVIEHLVHIALAQSTNVEFVHKDISKYGEVAAILRYPMIG